ncbi:MAG TPA: 50S ribosomal protein L20 [Polyangiaceae bacterium]|nr:50S ribosomal protein L20 [Polyangiaceae bacterium]
MPRAKRGVKARRRRNRIRQHAKGYRGGRSKLFKAMHQTVMHAWRFATRDRKRKKRDFRALWIVRINAAARELGVSYSKLIGALARKNVALDRKILADLAISDPAAFKQVVNTATA